jgi:Glycosyltransferases, probably involved in cell wall biogenesis
MVRTGTQQPLVSIVTPSRNQGKFIERTIRSVLAQNYPHIEYIVVDGMSSDETTNILKKYEPYITRIIREADTGQSNALNKGFQAATGEILAWLNSDDCYSSDSAVSEVVPFLGDNACDLVYGRRKHIDAQGNGVAFARPFRQFSYDTLKRWGYIPQECCFWTSEIYQRAGGFVDETYKMAMDYELWMRMLKNGARFLAVDRQVGFYRVHSESKSVANWKTKGLQEVARVQTEYCETVLTPQEMHLASIDYYTGIQCSHVPIFNTIVGALWSLMEKRVVPFKGSMPLDGWTYGDANLLERNRT